MSIIQNPVLPGFHPDPSIVRVGGDYYMAVSTFEWFPGVRIYQSRDLVRWKLAVCPLNRISLIDLKGNPDSGGVWAPCLSWSNGRFYLVYTDVKSLSGLFKDTHNYVTSAPSIDGPWSEPVYLNSSGFDPSLFHDGDGRSWLLNMVWDHRKGRNPFGGIVLQEYSLTEQRLVGDVRKIYAGTELGCTEGPHLYRRNGYYYLVTAEGGTGYDHAVTVARSRSLFGPYETDPENPVLTSADASHAALQKSGHASLVETPNGEWYMAHLCARPLNPERRCPLGRETALQRCEWTEDGWIRLAGGGRHPQVRVQVPEGAVDGKHAERGQTEEVTETDHFDTGSLASHFNTLRVPPDESWLSLKARPGYLRLHGRESLNSLHSQSLVARRVDALKSEAEVCLEFEPETFQQMAGLICYYNSKNFIYLFLSHDENRGKCLNVLTADGGRHDEPLSGPISIEGWTTIFLRVDMDGRDLRFHYSPDGKGWLTIDWSGDASKLSDDYCTVLTEKGSDWGFTGLFVGMAVQDVSGRRKAADFDYFRYRRVP